MKKVIGFGLILLSIYLGYLGITKFSNSDESVDIIGIEINVEDQGKKSTSYILLGSSIVSFIGGVFLISRKS